MTNPDRYEVQPGTADPLAPLRRKVEVRIVRLGTVLIGRIPPCWAWRGPQALHHRHRLSAAQ
jgi:hypothetical protein